MINFPISLSVLIEALRTGELDLLVYLDRLEQHFVERESELQAFVPEDGRFARLRREAQHLLNQYPTPDTRPSLFGVPVAVKDIFHVTGFTTRAGSQLPPEALQSPEATSVTLLKQAGAMVLGKAVTTEFAYFAPGPTRNPRHLEHTPGGSSSGSAAAVGAGLAPLALGTQTIGSVNRPAAFCGVVGYKPSYERISRAGVIPLSPSLDHVGLFTADVASAELVARLLCQGWETAETVSKPVLGIPEGPYLEKASPEGLAQFRATCEKLIQAGFKVQSVPAMPDFEEIYERHYLITAADAARVHTHWFTSYEASYHAKTAELIRRGQEVSDQQLEVAKNGRSQLRQQLTQLMDEHGLDLWLSPAAPGPAPKGLDSTGNPVMNLPWTQSGLPTLSLPSDFDEQGLPFGLQLTGRWQGDETMFRQAIEIEKMLLRK